MDASVVASSDSTFEAFPNTRLRWSRYHLCGDPEDAVEATVLHRLLQRLRIEDYIDSERTPCYPPQGGSTSSHESGISHTLWQVWPCEAACCGAASRASCKSELDRRIGDRLSLFMHQLTDDVLVRIHECGKVVRWLRGKCCRAWWSLAAYKSVEGSR